MNKEPGGDIMRSILIRIVAGLILLIVSSGLVGVASGYTKWVITNIEELNKQQARQQTQIDIDKEMHREFRQEIRDQLQSLNDKLDRMAQQRRSGQ